MNHKYSTIMLLFLMGIGGIAILASADIWTDEDIPNTVSLDAEVINHSVCIGSTCWGGYQLSVEHNASINGSQICTMASGCTNSSAPKFSGSWNDLTDIPAGFADNVDNTSALTAHNHTEADITDLNHYTDADIDGTETAFDGWDKNDGDDFDGAWSSLTGIPAGFADGIDNTSSGTGDGTGGWTNTSTETYTLLDVGIGTSSPSNALHVHDAGATQFRISQDLGVDYATFEVNTQGELIVTPSGENFGINTNPDYAFHVYESSQSNVMKIESGGGSAVVLLKDGGTTATNAMSFGSDNDDFVFTNQQGRIRFRASNSDANEERMVILGNGNVGIGTLAPSDLLEVQDDDDNDPQIKVSYPSAGKSATIGIYNSSGNMHSAIWFDTDNPTASNYALDKTSSVTSFNTPSGENMYFRVGNAAKMIIDDSGTISMGGVDFTPDAQLDVESTASTIKGLIVQGAASQSANLQEWQNSSGGVLSHIDEKGYLGILDNNPVESIHTDGNIYIQGSNHYLYGGSNRQSYINMYNSSSGKIDIKGLNNNGARIRGHLYVDGDLNVVGEFSPGYIVLANHDGYIQGGSGYKDNARINLYEGTTGDFNFFTGKRLNTSDFRFFTNGINISSANERFTITYEGKVGIGDPTPSEALEVAGNILATGTITETTGRVCTASNGLCNQTENDWHTHDQNLNTTDIVRFEGLSVMGSHGADIDINGTMYVHGGNGDINGDNTINVADISDMASYLTDVDFNFTSEEIGNADINGDNKVDYLDFSYIWQGFGTSGITDAQKREARYIAASLSVTDSGYALVGRDPPFAPTNQYVSGDGDLYVMRQLEVNENVSMSSSFFIRGGETLIQAQASTDIPLTLQGDSSQSANLLELKNVGDTVMTVIDNDGWIGAGGETTPLESIHTDGAIYIQGADNYLYGGANKQTKINFYNSSTGKLDIHTYSGGVHIFEDLLVDGDLSLGGSFSPGYISLTNQDGYIQGGGAYGDNARINFYEGTTADFNFFTGKRQNASDIRFFTNGYNITGANERMVITYDGFVGIGTKSPTEKLYVEGNTYITENLTVTGNITGNIHYGEMYFHNDTGETVTIPAVDTYINVTIMSGGNLNGVTHSSGVLTVNIAGIYKVDYSTSFSGGVGDEYHMSVGINGAEQVNCHNARVIGTGGDVGNAGGTCLLSLAASDGVTFMVENENDASDITLQDASLNLVRIGG